jgi:uncharacterized protein (TIGR03083 family)
MTSNDPVAALRASHDRLRALAGPFGSDDVRRHAYPSEWSIAQVLSHLGSGAQIMSLIVEAGVAGAESPAREAYQAIWDEWNAKDADAQAADGLAADGELVARIESLRGPEHAGTRFQIWVGEVDLAGLAASRLFEHALHSWDVAVALDPDARVFPDAVELIVDGGLGLLVGFAAKAGGRTDRIHIVTTDPDREFALTLGERSTLDTWDGGEASGTVRLPAEALVRLFYGRLDADHTPAVEADGITLDELRAVFPGF